MSFKKALALLAVPLMLFCLYGCEESTRPYIELDRDSYTFSSGGGDFVLHVHSSHEWSVSQILYEDGSNWISLSSNSGKDSYITVSANKNNGWNRSAKIEFYLNGYGIYKTLQIFQESESSSGGSTQISAPSSLRATVSGSTITLNWNSARNASYYNIYLMDNSWVCLGNTENTSCSLTAETPGTYTFSVTAVDSNGNESSYSNTASCTVNGSSSGGDSSKPSAPTGLSAYWDGPTSYPYVVLSWNSVSNATGYWVYRATSANGSYSQIGNSSYNSYTDNNVSIGKTYYYKVKASNSSGTSDYSSYTSVTLSDTRKPGPVKYGNCSATSTSITLRWTIPTDASYGKPTKIVLRLYDPTYKQWVDTQELSGTATSVTFSFGMWIDSDGYVKCGVIPYNDYGSGGGSAKVYDTKNRQWIN